METKKKTPNEEKEILLLFEQVKARVQLVFPTFFYSNMKDDLKPEENNKFIKYLCDNYIDNKQYKYLLKQIFNVPNIPIEILSKYYARIYTIDGQFFKDLKKDLLDTNDDNFKKYKAFIQTLFEGVERNALKTFDKIDLYSAQYLPQDEIDELIKHCNSREKDLPPSMIISKAFLSFSKSKKVADRFLVDNKKMLC